MTTAEAGLKTHIWNNNLKSAGLLALYPVLILGLVWMCALAIGVFTQPSQQGSYSAGATVDAAGDAVAFASAVLYTYWPVITGAVAVWFLIAWFFHSSMIRAMARSHPVTRQDEPELYNLLENLCITAGMTMPRLEVIETHARNAFASGLSEKSFCVTVTRGLMNSLTKDELEGVLAHELTHILNRDVRLLIITVIFTGMISFAAQLAWSHIRYSLYFGGMGRDRKGGGIALVFVIALILGLGYLISLLLRFAISRRREYMADAGAVELTKNPGAMMRALMRISGRAKIPESTADIAMMCIENKSAFLGMFATHPPIEKRIAALAAISGESIPDAASLPPVAAAARFDQGAQKNPWLSRGRGPRKQTPWDRQGRTH